MILFTDSLEFNKFFSYFLTVFLGHDHTEISTHISQRIQATDEWRCRWVKLTFSNEGKVSFELHFNFFIVFLSIEQDHLANVTLTHSVFPF